MLQSLWQMKKNLSQETICDTEWIPLFILSFCPSITIFSHGFGRSMQQTYPISKIFHCSSFWLTGSSSIALVPNFHDIFLVELLVCRRGGYPTQTWPTTPLAWLMGWENLPTRQQRAAAFLKYFLEMMYCAMYSSNEDRLGGQRFYQLLAGWS